MLHRDRSSRVDQQELVLSPLPRVGVYDAETDGQVDTILAGDFLKSASDLGLPIVGVGLLYQEGYFRQYLNVDGWQQERCAENDFFNLRVRPKTDEQGEPVTISTHAQDQPRRARRHGLPCLA